MRLSDYLKDKLINIFIFIITIMLIFIFLYNSNLNIYYIIFIDMIVIFGGTINFFVDFFKKKIYYDNFKKTYAELDEKVYVTQLIKKPHFIEGRILYDTLKSNEYYSNNAIASYNMKVEEYQSYIETWVHEVKTPISTAKLIIENNKNYITISIADEIDKIDNYVEQVLYFAKSGNLEKDYNIRRVSLKQMVMNEFKRKSKSIINENIRPNFDNLDYNVLADSKWIEFIIGQILTNCIKYKDENPTINIFAKRENSNINLYIKDNGIGILEKDLIKVFEKGYVGNNGRNISRSTGMGLYICKTLCDKMGIGIYIESKVNYGTTIKLVFKEAV